MIKTKQDLSNFLEKDLKDHPKRNIFLLWLQGNESLPIVVFMTCLRNYEYYYNQENRSLMAFIKMHMWRFLYRHSQLKYSLYIGINAAGPGLNLVHPGFRRAMNIAKIGSDCTILPMVLMGKKNPGVQGKIYIGDNCYISTGVVILAPVVIGNNVSIGAGAVVTKDIPDNCTVVGVPARIIDSTPNK